MEEMREAAVGLTLRFCYCYRQTGSQQKLQVIKFCISAGDFIPADGVGVTQCTASDFSRRDVAVGSETLAIPENIPKLGHPMAAQPVAF